MDKPSSKWYVRASQMGALMSRGQRKGESFGKVSLGVIKEAVNLNKWGIPPEDITSKYLTKGIINEPISIDMMMKHQSWTPKDSEGHLKKTRKFNDYVTGEADLFFESKDSGLILADVKSSYNKKTFDDNNHNLTASDDLKVTNRTYWYQMQCYMWLYNMEVSYLAFCLTDTPAHLISNEVYSETMRKNNLPENIYRDMDEVEAEITEAVEKRRVFAQIPEENKICVYEVRRDEDAIIDMMERVTESRMKYDEFYHKM